MAVKETGARGGDVEQAAFFAPIFVWTKHAVAGKSMSGVTVATHDEIDLARR